MLTEPAKRRSKKTMIPPVAVESGSGARRQMDDFLIQVWQDRFDTQDNQIAELTRTVRGFNGTPGLTQEMAAVRTILQEIKPAVDELRQYVVEERATLKAEVSSAKASATDSKSDVITLRWLFETFVKPVIPIVIAYLLFTLGPQLLKLIP